MTNEIRDEADIDNFVQRFEAVATAGPDLLSHLYNDHGNAERLIAMYGEDLRFCVSAGEKRPQFRRFCR